MNEIEPKISIIIPTRNSEKTIEKCLKSAQHYYAEIIIVDNFSTDQTQKIARTYADKVIIKGHERNDQRRAGAAAATATKLLFLDSDMVASRELISELISILDKAEAIIVPEVPFGVDTFWTRVKCAERACYAGCDATEAARAFTKEAYLELGGFDEAMISCEDWDLTEKLKAQNAVIVRSVATLAHDEGHVTLRNIIQKKAYYGAKASGFTQIHGLKKAMLKMPLLRKSLWKGVWQNRQKPALALGIVILSSLTTMAGAWGFLTRKRT